MTKKQLLTWIEQMGGIAKAASYLGVNYTTVWRWINSPSKVKRSVSLIIQWQIENGTYGEQ